MTNKFTARGIRKDNGEFVYGFAVCYNNKWEILPCTSMKDERIEDVKAVEITQEPDQFIQTIDGVDYYENDEVKITKYGLDIDIQEDAFNSKVVVLRSVDDLYLNYPCDPVLATSKYTREITGNTHGLDK